MQTELSASNQHSSAELPTLQDNLPIDLNQLDKESRYILFDNLILHDKDATGAKYSVLYNLYQLRATNQANKALVDDYLSNGLLRRQKAGYCPYRFILGYPEDQQRLARSRAFNRYKRYTMFIENAVRFNNTHFMTEIAPKWFGPGHRFPKTSKNNQGNTQTTDYNQMLQEFLYETFLRSLIDGNGSLSPMLIKLMPRSKWQVRSRDAITYYFTSSRKKELTPELLHEFIDLIHDDNMFQWLQSKFPILAWAKEHEDQEVIELCESLRTQPATL